MLNKPYDFTPRVSIAKAIEINANYDTLYDFLNAYLIVGNEDPEGNISATVPCVYLNETSGKIFKKTDIGSTGETSTGWVELGTSENDYYILRGEGVPSSSLGEIGYLYQDTTNGKLYRKISETVWSEIKTSDQALNINSSVQFNSVSCNSIVINEQNMPSITGENDNVALTSLLTALQNLRIITDNTEAIPTQVQLFTNDWSSNSKEGIGSLFTYPSRNFSGTDLYNVLDGNNSTFFTSFTYSGDEFRWGINLDTPSVCNKIRIFTPTDPTNVRWGFILQGTNESNPAYYNSSALYDYLFDTLLDISDDYESWNINDFTDFNFENSQSYKVYRLKRKTNVEGRLTNLHEVQFWGG